MSLIISGGQIAPSPVAGLVKRLNGHCSLIPCLWVMAKQIS